MKIIDFHAHLADPKWLASDPLLAGARALYGRVRPFLPDGARRALELAGALAEPAARSLRDGALDLASRAIALSRNRAMYLGPLGARLAAHGDGLLEASFLRATPENLVRDMDRASVSAAVVLPVEPYTSTELVLSLCRGNPRLIAFGCVPAREKDVAAAVLRMKDRGCRGLKVHPSIQDVSPDGKYLRDVADAAARTGLPIVAHTGEVRLKAYARPEWSRIDAYEKVVREFRSARFVMAHMNLFEPDAAIEFARRHENVLLDTSWQPEGAIRRAHRVLGSTRLLFATDWPFLGARPDVATGIVARALGRQPAALERVLSRNAIELLRLEHS